MSCRDEIIDEEDAIRSSFAFPIRLESERILKSRPIVQFRLPLGREGLRTLMQDRADVPGNHS